ncbi:MAG: gluconate 2-dehydrogenase subunit 3 family protein [Pyrinomonadaceae bacterium]|nr:gluconate 2-dehydrogenase subunit 3 family protein [Pyrinomonadaceae bacterium]
MSDEKNISRRAALKVIAVGVGTASTLPILEDCVLGQHKHHDMEMGRSPDASVPAAEAGRFFNPKEMETIAAISDLIIPTDEHSPGARAAGVPGFIDLMVSESSNEVKALWRDGLMAVDRMSELQFSAPFSRAGQEQQISLLKAISRNERRPNTIEERFFIAIKSLTVDGYYTSPIGIHQDLRYKGNAYLKDFVGCTHPEHKG